MTRADPKYQHVGIYLQALAGGMLFLAVLVHIGDRAQHGSPLSAPSAAVAALENEDDRAVRALREINEFDGGRGGGLDADMEDDVLIAY